MAIVKYLYIYRGYYFMPTYSRLLIKHNTKVSDVINNKNYNPVQQRAAHIFDTNGDGVYTGREVTLFNSTCCTLNNNGDITLWTKFASGKKNKTTFTNDELISCTLKNNGNCIEKIKRPTAFDEFVWEKDEQGNDVQREKKVEIYNNFKLKTYSEVRQIRKENLDKLVAKYNLINKNINSEIFNVSKNIIKNFHQEYGNPLSYSMEYLLVSPFYKVDSKFDKGKNVHEKWNSFDNKNTLEVLNERSKLVKKYNYANCGQQTEMVEKLIYDNYKFNYNTRVIYTNHEDSSNKGHQAILIVSKDKKEEYVIDTWLCKEGGIFRKSDWQKLVSEIYNSEAKIDYSYGNLGYLKYDYEHNLLKSKNGQ